ncbi:SirB2 family protein [Lysobacter brunescens]|uniref:SirB2 family protein n=1 Tax=Lysobacter brunescens TaxID=262323 RepID=A0ABW2Y9G9_9GAMM
MDPSGLLAWYPQLRTLHIACVLLSGALFFARGTSVLAGAAWPMRKPVRLTSYAIDSVLLAAALALAAILPVAMFANGWLTAKIVLLFVYIALGTFALKRARTQRAKALCFAGAVAVFLFMISVARAHHPLGVFAGWMG